MVLKSVFRDIEILECLMILDGLRERGQISVTETIVLHGKLLQVFIQIQHVYDVFYRIACHLIPADVEEL